MFKLKMLFVLAMIVVVIGAAAIAGDEPSGKTETEQTTQMPPTGPPEQMKMLSDLPGTWNVDQQWKMSPEDTTWQSFPGVSVYKEILDGCAMQFTMKSQMMGMPYEGLGIITYNRETGKWQTIWIDNMGAGMGYYQGDFKNGKFVVSGEEKWQGQTYHSRITTYNITPQKFDWMFEMSTDGGKTWMVMGKSVYTKKS